MSVLAAAPTETARNRKRSYLPGGYIQATVCKPCSGDNYRVQQDTQHMTHVYSYGRNTYQTHANIITDNTHKHKHTDNTETYVHIQK